MTALSILGGIAKRAERMEIRYIPNHEVMEPDGTRILCPRELALYHRVNWLIRGEVSEEVGFMTEIHKGDFSEKLPELRAQIVMIYPWALQKFDEVVAVMDHPDHQHCDTVAVAKK